MYLAFKLLAMDDKIRPSEVFVNVAVEVYEVNEEEVGNEHVKEVLENKT